MWEKYLAERVLPGFGVSCKNHRKSLTYAFGVKFSSGAELSHLPGRLAWPVEADDLEAAPDVKDPVKRIRKTENPLPRAEAAGCPLPATPVSVVSLEIPGFPSSHSRFPESSSHSRFPYPGFFLEKFPEKS